MKIIIVYLCSFFALFSTSLDEVLKLALKNNYLLDAQKHTFESYEMKNKSLKSLFFPKVGLNYIYSYSAPQNRPTYDFNTINASLNYNIFNGMKDYGAYKKTLSDIKIQDNNLDSIKNDIVLNTKTTFIKILQDRESIKIAKSSIELLQMQLKQANAFFQQGISDKSAVLSVEVGLANAKMELSKVELSLKYNLDNLAKLSGQYFEASNLEDIKFNEANYDKNQILDSIYENNPQFKNLKFMQEKNSFDIQIAKGSYYPAINFHATKFWYFTGSNVSYLNYGLQSQARITLSWDITSAYNAFYDSQSQRAVELSLISQTSDLKKDIEVTLTKLLNDLEVSKKQYAIAQIALNQASENYRIVSNKYRQNVANYIELLNAELLLTNAKNSLVNTRYEIELNIAQIHHLQNQHF